MFKYNIPRMIAYTPETYAFTGKNYPTMTETEFARAIAKKQSVYEVIPSNMNVKYYFDVDLKVASTGIDFDNGLAETIEKKCYGYICDALNASTGIEPNIAITTSHSSEKYSFHYYVSNIVGTKENIKDFVCDLNYWIKTKADGMENIYDWIDPENKMPNIFDEVVYKSDQKMRCVNASKPNENRPLALKAGSIEQTIITGFFDEDAFTLDYKAQRPKSPTSVVPFNNNTSKETKDKYVDLLFNIIGNGEHINFQKWFQIAGILKCNGYSFDILEEYTAFVDKENPKTYKIWNSINTSKPLSIFGLQNIAKSINPNAYYDWLKKHNEYISYDTLQKGSNDVSKYIAKTLKDILIYCKSEWYACLNNLWIVIDNPNSIIVSAIQDEIDKLLKVHTDKLNMISDEEEKQKERKTINSINDMRRQVCGCMRQYRELLQGYLLNNEFCDLLDVNEYQIAYKNGILDLRTLEFRDYIQPSDFITRTLSFNYEKANAEDKKKVREELKKICNYNEAHLDYYLSRIGYAMTGDADKEQEFYYLLGQKACNGKSTVFEALSEIMGCYCRKMGRDVFDPKNTTLHKEIAVWRGIRIGWANEISAKMDAELLKDTADGKPMSFKALFKNAQKMPVSFKAFMVSNHSPTIDSDAGIKRRMRLMQMDSEFVDGLQENDIANCRFKMDKSFCDKLVGEYKHALLELIFEYSQKVANDKVFKYPEDWKEIATDALEENDPFKSWFENTFEFGEFELSEYKLKNMMKSSNFGNVKLADQVKKYKWAIKRNRETKSWIGIGIKTVKQEVAETDGFDE